MAATTVTDDDMPIFDVERVQLQFSVAADFVAAQVANNVLVLALSNGRILRIDLNRPEDIDDIDLPRKSSEIGVIRHMFLDPTASHLIICTTHGDNFYLHSQTRQPRPLAKLRGVLVESIAWNPSLPTASTREILLGAADGNIYETYIESSTEFYRKGDKYVKHLTKLPDGPAVGLWVDSRPDCPDHRRVLMATRTRLSHLSGKIGRGNDGSASLYTKLFDAEQPVVHELQGSVTPNTPAALVVSPDLQGVPASSSHEAGGVTERAFAWLSSHGVYHGGLLTDLTDHDLGDKVFAESKFLPRSQIMSPAAGSGRPRSSTTATTTEYVEAIALTHWHIVAVVGNRAVAVNRLSGSIVYDQVILEQGQKAIGLCVDIQKNTFWLFTDQEIFEILTRDEDRDIWKIMLELQQYDAAAQYARTPTQKDAVATASGDHFIKKGLYSEAASVYGKSSKPLEEVALTFLDHDEHDALRKYLLVKLGTYQKSWVMQRTMISCWLVEIFMAKMNSLDDTIMTQAELSESLDPAQSQEQLDAVRREYQQFVSRNRSDLDQKTVYGIISSHDREEELLYFAEAVDDYDYVLSYWIQRERWREALSVLQKQTDPDVFYRSSTVLMTHVAHDLVDILMRQADLQPRKLIPALLEYDRNFHGPLIQNQAVRYLQFVINQLQSTDSAIHNTLMSMYASHSSRDESTLLAYLESQGDDARYDPDFALRLCIQHRRVLSCVHIYTSMGQYLEAVKLALSHDEIELASIVANRPMTQPALRKKLWLAVAKKVIGQSNGIKTAIELLQRCELLKIEDLIPFFPDFVVIDDFKDEICAALEDYGRNIDALRKEMDQSSLTATNIQTDMATLVQRYTIIEPGEPCYACALPLLNRQFFVFPCQHAFHSDCLARHVLEQAPTAKKKRIKECQVQISKGLVSGSKREAVVAELDSLVASACILCGEYAIKRIDEPFINDNEDQGEWAI